MNNINKLLKAISFIPKENATDIYIKKYQDDYSIEVDFKNLIIDYGSKIKSESSTTQNFSQSENWVVLECVNRLLEKGYKPENIILEKTYPAGHGHSGRLDICVNRENSKDEYLLIECKTYGKEFEKEFNRLKKDGGQLFTYFKFSNKADLIMLYTSDLIGDKIEFKNEIIKIEEDYRTGDVKDFYEKWNKFTKDNGIFDSWVNPYNFVSKALTLEHLKPIEQEDSSFIFNRFLEILRHNVVSDKPNAFNKIFTLFLCKVYDEKSKKPDEQLDFQWLEGQDNDVSFQIRLTELYKKGMLEFLEKEVSDFSEDEFNNEYAGLSEDIKSKLMLRINKLRLEKNNEFAIKEVFDEHSFKENAKIVKEVVELLQGYKLRYNKRQQYLSDFFELLLTTGLKQESGQFFTPVPIAQFIIKSLPIDKIVEDKLEAGENNNLLPFVIDYAAGSGHFLTESMHEIQRLIDNKNPEKFIEKTSKKIKSWKNDHFDWATQYVYGIEKDYRLVKVGKVGCYLHGDGLANVILSDGLARFDNQEYKGKLQINDANFPKENKQFDIVISNPPYSVSAFKNASRDYYGENEFELYNSLSDFSSEIEVLFVERTQQLLKDGGVAGIILPSSILSNSGSYSKAREIILKYFDIIAITELGSNTFMATGTNTVVLFLRRKNNYISINLLKSIENFFNTFQDLTLLGIEKPISKYINHTWENINFEDYISLIQKNPNENIINNELFIEYKSKIKHKNETDLFNKIIEIEKEKIFYFILAFNQKVVIVKSGSKDDEKRFLGYEFSFRRGSEGIHPIQRGKSISECTKLFDEDTFTNPEKASTYIYNAFKNNYDLEVNETLKKNIFYQDLIDLLTFDRSEFQNNINLSIKKKVKIESKWEVVKLDDIIELISGQSPESDFYNQENKGMPFYQGKTEFGELYLEKPKYWTEKITKESIKGDILMTVRAPVGPVNLNPFDKICIGRGLNALRVSNKILNIYLFYYLKSNQEQINGNEGAIFQSISRDQILSLKIPLPPLQIQEKIVSEIEVLEAKEKKAKEDILELRSEVDKNFENNIKKSNIFLLKDIIKLQNGKDLSKSSKIEGEYLIYGGNGILGKLNEFLIEKQTIAIGRVGAYCGAIHLTKEKSWITDNSMFVSNYLKEVDIKFLYYSLKKLNLNQYANAASHPNISQPTVLNQKIPLPPIEEQEKIVKEIEQIEQEIDKLENELKKIPKQKEEILKKYL